MHPVNIISSLVGVSRHVSYVDMTSPGGLDILIHRYLMHRYSFNTTDKMAIDCQMDRTINELQTEALTVE
eukprot:scaffold19302_cov92-Skeletonema_dohrnii-CCMP3373.AAC.1